MAVSESLSYVLWIDNLLREHIGDNITTILLQDNTSTINLLNKGIRGSLRTRHLEIRNLLIKEYIENGTIIVRYMESSLNLADCLTKPLHGELFKKHRDNLLGIVA